MTMTLHKLTAGDGYQYLIRQVAVTDSTSLGRSSLSDYYSAKGESPGHWVGSGLVSLSDTGARPVSPQAVEELWTVTAGSEVTAEQMRALFGEGRHPNAEAISAYVTARGVHGYAAMDAAKLGREFYIHDGETGFLRALAVAYREHNEAAGQKWNAPLDASTRAAIRTALAREKFSERYGRAPADDRELSGFIAHETRARTTAVAGYDLTFSPVKSVSALWAIAPLSVSQTIEEAHDAAVADTLAWLEQQAAFTRSGTNGVAQLDTTGLIGAAFTHRDSRAGDPDLHTHVAISNKVAVDADGAQRWLALDGQPLHRVTVAASELYNTRLEAHLGQRLSLRFADVKTTERGKRAIREIVGMSTELMRQWSSRRAAIERRTAELSKTFQATHGREPTFVEMIALSQQATLESREAKHEPRSLAEQRRTWRTQAIDTLGGTRELTAMLGAILSTPAQQVEPATAEWISTQAAKVIATVSATRANWLSHHVLAEAQRAVRASGHAGNSTLAQRITEKALSEPLSLPHTRVTDGDMGEPAMLRRHDGASVYTRHGTAVYTCATVVAAERRILATAHQRGGRRVSDSDVELALADSAARGKPLNPGQVALVTEMATNGRRLALSLAPAGTGKTTAMAALSHAWRSSGGNVIGLAPTAAAAIELGSDLSAPTDTLAKLVWSAGLAATASRACPPWLNRIGPKTLVIIDEAGKAGTVELDAAISYTLTRGASVRLVGDDCQLASISAGGVLRDIAAETETLTLSELVRFASQSEGAATLALRSGDPAGLAYYIDHHRVHVGSEATAADMAYVAWCADRDAGRDSILLAPTNAVVNDLNARARLDRISADGQQSVGPEAVLADQLAASAGDIIRTRRNARWLRMGDKDFVRNGYRYTVTEVLNNGGLRARHEPSGRAVTLPPNYVARQVTLGYAATIDSAQGLTAQYGCHIVGAGHLTRQLLYVALTRGRIENHIYLSTAEADPHRVLSPKATHPDTAVDVLRKTLARDGAQISSTTAARVAADPFGRLAGAADMYYDALGAAADERLDPVVKAELYTSAEALCPQLTGCPAWPVLHRHLALLAANGDDPAAVLAAAISQRPLDSARDPAAVLDWRIDPTGGHSARIGPLRWLPAIPAKLADNPLWGPYLLRRSGLVTKLADQIRTAVNAWTPATAPTWAKSIVDINPKLAAEIAVFRAAHAVAPEDTRLLGARQEAANTRAIQQLLEQAAAAITQRCPDTQRWAQLIDSINPRIRYDSYWPQLAARLADTARTNPNLARLVTTIAAARALPDELPAAALWWRLSADLTAAAPLQTTQSRLRPVWVRDLHAVFGSAIAETITTDPAWPDLVAAIAAADPQRWSPLNLLHLAAEHLTDADPDHTIPVYDYTRLITYTVDLFCTPQQPVDDALPERPPIHPDDEEQLPPDPHATCTDEFAKPLHNNLFHTGPGGIDGPSTVAAPAHQLQLVFDDLATARPASPAWQPALTDVHALRAHYTARLTQLATLEHDVRINNGPAMRAAMPHIRELRQRADTDRPYLLAIQGVIAAWADADHAYQDALNHLDWARYQLAQLRTNPLADPYDIESAHRYVRVVSMTVPTSSPAEQYHPQLVTATAARAAAVGGPDKIISGNDVDKYIAELNHADWQAVHQARRDLTELRAELDRAEVVAAAAFAVAETRTAQHITTQRDLLNTEIRVLEVAGTYQPEQAVAIGPHALTGMPPATAGALTALAELPFTVTALHAAPSKELTQALHTLHAAASAAGRKMLWCSQNNEQAEAAKELQLADTATTISDAHAKLSSRHWNMPPHSLLIVDDAATAQPAILAELAELAHQSQARLILINTTTQQWPPQPSQRLLRLLNSELPWSMTLGSAPIPQDVNHRQAANLDPILTQTRRLSPDLLDEQLRHILTRADQLRTSHINTHQRHLKLTWTHHHHHNTSIERNPDPSLDVSDE